MQTEPEAHAERDDLHEEHIHCAAANILAAAIPQRVKQRDLHDRGERNHERQTGVAPFTHAEPIERQARGHAQRAHDGGKERVLRGIKTAHDHGLPRNGKRADEKEAEHFRSARRGERVEAAALKENVNRFVAHEKEQSRARNHERDVTAQRVIEQLVHLRHFTLGHEPREIGKRGRARGLPEERDENEHHTQRIVERGDAPLRQIRAEEAREQLVREDHGEAEHERQRERDVLFEIGMAPFENQIEAHAGAPCAEVLHEKTADERAARCAPRKAFHAEPATEQHAAGDDADIINERRERGQLELLLRELHGHQHAADEEEELRGQHDARHAHRARNLRRISQTGRAHGHEHVRETPCECDHHREHRAERAENDGEHAPAFGFIVAREIVREDRNERDGEKAAADDVIENIGKIERDIVSIDRGIRAADLRNDDFAQQADDTAEQHRGHHDERRESDFFVEGGRQRF